MCIRGIAVFFVISEMNALDTVNAYFSVPVHLVKDESTLDRHLLHLKKTNNRFIAWHLMGEADSLTYGNS